MALTTSGAVPLLVKVIAIGALDAPTGVLPNDTALEDSRAAGAAATPVPLTLTERGESLADDDTLTAALRPPEACGVNVTLNVHEACAARTAPLQLSAETLKSPPFAPVD